MIRTVEREERSATAGRDPHNSRDLAVSTAPNTVLPLTAAPGASLPSSTAASTSTLADTTTRVSQSQPLPVPSLTSLSLLPLPVPPPLLQSVALGRGGAGDAVKRGITEYSRTSIIRTPLATGVRIRVRIIEIVRITKINTVLFEHMRKLMIFILYNYIHDIP